jgi:hypothetical protein
MAKLIAAPAVADLIIARIAASERKMHMISKIKAIASKIARDHYELVIVAPVMMAILWATWFIGWRIGNPQIELGALLIDYAVGALAVFVVSYVGWLIKKTHWHDLSNKDEARLHAEAEKGNKAAFWLIVKDRIEWVAVVIFVMIAFSLFSGAVSASTLTAEQRCAKELLVRWEVTSQVRYERALQSPNWPGGASGVTWGIGYDGGHQSTATIAREWFAHPHVDRLTTTAGLTGESARAALPRYRDIVVPWSMATDVLVTHSLPRYIALARQAYGRQLDTAPAGVRCALGSETYNRGAGMAGSRRAERRHIRDHCLPRRDWECVAQQLEASCRVWANDRTNGEGLCNRRRDEAAAARRWSS